MTSEKYTNTNTDLLLVVKYRAILMNPINKPRRSR